MGISISLGELVGLGCAFFWALNSLILRTQCFKIPPALMNAVRCGVAGVTFWFLLPFGPPLSSFGQVLPHEWALLVGAVLVGMVIGDTLYIHAIREIGVSRTLALVGTYPLNTLLFERVLLRHPFPPSFYVGSFLVAAGVVCLSIRSRSAAEADAASAVPVRLTFGVLLSVAAAMLWGLSTVMLKPAIAHLTPVQTNSVRLPLVALVLYLTRSWAEPPVRLKEVDRRALLIVAVSGAIGIGIGSFLFLMAIDLTGPAKAAVLSSVAPVFGTAMAMAFLKEEVTLGTVSGMLLCMAGVWLVL